MNNELVAGKAAVDRFAILRRYAGWPAVIAIVVMYSLLWFSRMSAGPQTVPREWHRLEMTALTAKDPQVTAEARRRQAALELTWQYRLRHVIEWGPSSVVMILLIWVYRIGFRFTRAVQRAEAGQCMKCAYDLRGSGFQNACPECGTKPAPIKEKPAQLPPRRTRRLLLAGAFLLCLVPGGLFFVTGPRSVGSLMGFGQAHRVRSAYDAAPRVAVRWSRVLADNGPYQFVFLHDRETGFTRQETWEGGTLEEAIVLQVGLGSERYLPDRGVARHPGVLVKPRRGDSRQSFEDVQVRVMADAPSYESKQIVVGPPYDVYRQVERGGLHHHHARGIDITVIDTATQRPLFQWSGTFDEQIDPAADPTLRRAWIIEMEYPAVAPGPGVRRIDKDKPGILLVDRPAYPDWLDKDWIDPVLDGR